jgi:molecular chaperone GrpE
VDVDALIDRFRDWLDAASAESESEAAPLGVAQEDAEPIRDFGLIDLIEEFTALRHELKLQTKSSRGLSEQAETMMGALKQAIEQFRSVEPNEEQAAWTTGKSLALGLADLDEALHRAGGEIERARTQIADNGPKSLESALEDLRRGQSWLHRWLFRQTHKQLIEIAKRDGVSRHSLFDSFSEGFGLIQKRLHRLLAAEQIESIPCEGRAVDPELMTVLELIDSRSQPSGTVTKELRRGYTWRRRVLRFAEVQAARTASAARSQLAEESF